MADFNGDRNLDVVTGNASFGTQVSLLTGNGAGGVQETAEPNLGILFPASIVVADFNKDGIPDLAAASGYSTAAFGTAVQQAVGVALGNGTFQAPQVLTTGGYPQARAIGDFNRDGRPDIVTANFGPDSVSVFLGNGKGAFQTALNFSIDSTPAGIAVGDFNGDGFPDLAVTEFSTKSMAILINDGVWPAVTTASATPTRSSSSAATKNNRLAGKGCQCL